MIYQAPKEDRMRLIGLDFDHDSFKVGAGKNSDLIEECTIKNSLMEIVDNKKFIFFSCKFENTDFVFKKKASLDILFSSNYWEKCRFAGTHEGTMFGYWDESEHGPCPWGNISIRECDFSKSNLLCASFYRIELETTVFPSWPCFTILRPIENLPAFKKAPLPFSTRIYEYAETTAMALSYNWNWVKKAYELTADENEVRDVLSKLDFVRL